MNTEVATREDSRSEIRASDSEREHVARIMQAAAAQGLLSLDEADERMAAVYAARTRAELAPLTLDLPDGGRRLLENTPEARNAARAGLIRHAVTVAVVAFLLIGVFFATGAQFFWPAWPLAFMAFSLIGHARRIGVLPDRRRHWHR
ncbi:MAG: DUF1707 domain-containing protein [Geodermatophilaceae bacterium]|nr:DUF1707 domain-containing protein [Geodermatophilaceae bacterium]